jgi:hypothetical protein
MVMHYIGKHGDFTLNWTGHSYMLTLLTQLNADLSEWSGTNDGETIGEPTGKAWARLIRDNISRVKQIRIPDKGYSDGYRNAPLVEGMTTVEEELTTGETAQLILMENAIAAGFGQERVTINPNEVKVVELSQGTRDWVLGFARFLDECGGCEQW